MLLSCSGCSDKRALKPLPVCGCALQLVDGAVKRKIRLDGWKCEEKKEWMKGQETHVSCWSWQTNSPLVRRRATTITSSLCFFFTPSPSSSCTYPIKHWRKRVALSSIFWRGLDEAADSTLKRVKLMVGAAPSACGHVLPGNRLRLSGDKRGCVLF